MLFETQKTIEAESYSGVRFAVRRLNLIQRAARDAKVMEPRLQYTLRLAELRQLTHDIVGTIEDPDERLKPLQEALKADPQKAERYLRLEHACTCIRDEHLLPAAIRAALVEVEYEGRKLSVDEFLESAPDNLLLEVYARCEEASGLGEEERKNSPSPGTSAGQGSDIPSGSASDAKPAATTGAGTAGSISLS
jgi:hypothetical protein